MGRERERGLYLYEMGRHEAGRGYLTSAKAKDFSGWRTRNARTGAFSWNPHGDGEETNRFPEKGRPR